MACFIAVWYVASCFTQPLFIPAPATVWEAIVGLAETGQLQKRTCLLFPADYWCVCSFYAGSNSPLPSDLWREAYQGNYHAGCFLPAVCSRNRIFSAPDLQSLATKYNGKPAIQAPRSGVTFDAPKSKVKEERK